MELLPCPFCGGEAATTQDKEHPHRWSVRCASCGMGDDDYKAEAWAAQVWNNRPTARNHDARLAAVAAVCEAPGVNAEDTAIAELARVYEALTGAQPKAAPFNPGVPSVRSGYTMIDRRAGTTDLTDPIAHALLQNPD